MQRHVNMCPKLKEKLNPTQLKALKQSSKAIKISHSERSHLDHKESRERQ